MDALDGSFFNYTEFVNGEADDNLSMDIQAIIKVLDEDCNPSESSAEDSLMKNVSPGESGSHDNSQPQSGTSVLDYEHGNQEPLLQTCSPLFNLHGNYSDLYFVDDNDVTCYTGRMGVSGYSIPTHSVEPSFSEVHLNNTSDCGNNSCQDPLKGESESQLKHEGEDVEYGSHYSFTGGIERNSGHYGCINEDTREATFMDSDRSSHIGTSSDSTIYQGSNVDNGFSNYFPSLQLGRGTDCNTFFAGSSLGYPDGGFFPHLPYKEEMITNMKEEKEFLADTAHVSSNMHSSTIGGTPFQDTKFMSSDSENSSFFGGNVLGEDKEPMQPSAHDLYMLYEDQAISIKHERDEPVRSCQKFSHADNFEESMGQDLNQMPGFFSSVECQNYDLLQHGDKNTSIGFDRVNHHQDILDGASSRFLENVVSSDINASEISLPYPQASVACEKQFGFVGGEGDGKMIQHSSINCNFSKVSTEYSQRDFLKRSHVEDDSDVCIIEDISHPAPKSQSGDLRNSLSLTQSSTYADSQRYMLGGTRLKARDESYILQVALQQARVLQKWRRVGIPPVLVLYHRIHIHLDLSQPKSEISPPDGLLAVPLLRHQRIALSWMVQKERSSSYCSGGILADDQGLGKTVSTIALMLVERPPMLGAIPQKGELETLSLDEDDDVLPGNDEVKKETSTCLDMPSRCPMKRMNLVVQPKGRPSAGTLIVCPTSVLRQWAEELHSKVTSNANFSVLVYHGSSRTKDPYELVKYDVVLTTYSIVSLEVPKQPLVDKDDEEKGSSEDQGVTSMALPSSRKRKNPPSSSKNSKKGLDGKLLEVVAGPLAKVAWFRVVLDEAQSIKNHRTQVARACWGLRAKRRWCLSGTPIQNAIDDLYSYFRFLRYDPYAVYTSFCSTIKIPINRNPTKGYRKLQAVLKTIMLRRTKGTLLDGEPIINLPPKSVELKKVDFSKEERDFYSRLEADSRAQFQEYADAGTVKQNYVNILLMLLRLRQACDHPLLVRHYDSNTLWRSSAEIAKKLPREKQIGLLKCLEASLTLCGICNDAPEDAVVSVCGHVFCNQCICEHLTGEDNQCPATNCRVRLSMSSVFTKGTLNCSLSDQADCNKSNGCSGSEIDGYDPFAQDMQYDSSKIKAALEVLHSLSNPQGHTSTNTSTQGTFEESSDCPGSSSDACNDHQNQNLSGDRSSNESIVVVREKAIVFSQWTRMLDLLEGCLKNSSIQYRRLDGTMSVIARDKAVKDFNTLPEVTVMIMSLKAASLGLNMVAACHVLLLDLWWNPTTEDQAIDRAHRIGQTRPVTVLRLTVRDTVEDRILALQQKKRKMVASAFGEDGTGGRQSRLTVDDLKYLFMM